MPNVEQKACRECGLEIPVKARKCSHCDSFQDWRSYVSSSTHTLSLLVALVSVSGLTIPAIVESFSAGPQLVAFIDGDSTPRLRVANLGNKPTLIQREATIKSSNDNIGLLRVNLSANADATFVVTPLGEVSFNISRNGSGRKTYYISAVYPASAPVKNGTAGVITIRYGGARSSRTLSLECQLVLEEV